MVDVGVSWVKNARMLLKHYFPDRNFRALLFDFDGTVADTMAPHFQAWNKALAPHSIQMTTQQHLGWAGRPTREIVHLLNELHNKQMTFEEIANSKEGHYFGLLDNVKTILPVDRIVRAYHGRIPLAIVSGSRRKPVALTLKRLGMTNLFEAIVCAEDYTLGKPDPECFLKAAALLNVQPQDCLVFEDAELGVRAAKAAGMACIRVEVLPQGGGHALRVEG